MTGRKLPVYPGGQRQINPFTWSTHVPPFWHGSDVHSSISVSHLEPANGVGFKGASDGNISTATSTSIPINLKDTLAYGKCDVCFSVVKPWNIHLYMIAYGVVTVATRLRRDCDSTAAHRPQGLPCVQCESHGNRAVVVITASGKRQIFRVKCNVQN